MKHPLKDSTSKHNYADIEDQSFKRFFLSLFIACALLLFLTLIFIRSEFKPPVILPPLMELDYVTIETPKETPPLPPPPRVIPKQVVQKTIEEQTPVIPDEPLQEEVPLEKSNDVSATVHIPSVPQSLNGTPSVSQQPIRIQSAAELDNTEFDPIFNPKPQYPRSALEAGIQGYVDADLVVNEFGNIESYNFTQISGHPSFGTETAKVITRWRFPPPRIGGKKVKVTYNYRINFKLN